MAQVNAYAPEHVAFHKKEGILNYLILAMSIRW